MIGSLARIAGLAELELCHHSMPGIDTHVHGHLFTQAAQGDKGSRDGDAAEGDLCCQQHIAERPASARRGLTAAALDRVIWIRLEYLAQWHHSEQNARECGDKQAHQYQRGLRCDMELDWVLGGWVPVAEASDGHPR